MLTGIYGSSVRAWFDSVVAPDVTISLHEERGPNGYIWWYIRLRRVGVVTFERARRREAAGVDCFERTVEIHERGGSLGEIRV